MKASLTIFLSENGALNNYIMNCMNEGFSGNDILSFLEDNSLSSGFRWDLSLEGFEYWLDLSERFNGEENEQ